MIFYTWRILKLFEYTSAKHAQDVFKHHEAVFYMKHQQKSQT